MAKFIRAGGIVDLKLSPPIEFIEEQHGRFRVALNDLTGLWRRFAQTMAAIERDRFATEGHGDWPPLAPSTLIEKEREGFPWFPLIRTGKLYESLTDSELAMRMDPQTMTWGTDVPYAQYHQEGATWTTRKTRSGRSGPGVGIRAGAAVSFTEDTVHHLPQRKVLDLSVSDRRLLETDMVAWLNERARSAFGVRA